jgi:uncharacterized protein (TIGR00297 family)
VTETIFAPNGSLSLVGRAIVGLALAIVAALFARRARSLSGSGAVAAAACGALCVTAGWKWAGLLIAYFVAATTLSWAGKEDKEERSAGVVSKGGRRDAMQVLANGGVYSLAAALTVAIPAQYVIWGAIGALAASSADTWATEIGVWLGGEPRLLTNGTIVRPGTSGGVTPAGMLGSVSGAAWIALCAMLAGFRGHGVVLAALIGGFGGSIIDSLLGATVQERRWCDACGEPTEQTIHRCGATTHRVGGIVRLNNDVVNLLSTAAGFLLGVIVYAIARYFGQSGIDWVASALR